MNIASLPVTRVFGLFKAAVVGLTAVALATALLACKREPETKPVQYSAGNVPTATAPAPLAQLAIDPVADQLIIEEVVQPSTSMQTQRSKRAHKSSKNQPYFSQRVVIHQALINRGAGTPIKASPVTVSM